MVAPRAADQPVLLLLVVVGDDLELLVPLVGARPPRRQRPRLPALVLGLPLSLLLDLLPPRDLLGVGDHRHGDAVAAEVDPRRPRIGAAVRRRPIDLQSPRPLRLEDPLALGLDQHSEGLAAEPDLGRAPRLAAALSKFLPSPLSRQAISRTPRLMVPSAASSHRSRGAVVPSSGEYHRRRHSWTRPLIVSTVKSCRPLFRLVLPVCGSAGGGKSGFRRIDSHLHGRLIGLPAKAREEVADLLLAGRDDMPRRRLVDRVGDPAERLLDLPPHLSDVLIARQLDFRLHGKAPK